MKHQAFDVLDGTYLPTFDFKKIRRIPRQRRRRTEVMVQFCGAGNPGLAIEPWLIRSGISPNANHVVSHIGIYTDFT